MQANFITEESGMISLEPWLGQSSVSIAIRYQSLSTTNNARSWQVHEFTVWTGGVSSVIDNPNPWAEQITIDGWLWADLSADGSDSVGMWLHTEFWPFVYSDEHGWLYMYAAGYPELFWYDFQGGIGWVYSGVGLYPWLYIYVDSNWAFYTIGSGVSGEGRLFFAPGVQ
ncbi:MAG: hypothetical protein LR015_04425 [Verrucomicrobia bacterium]|nr:hypothetical protein [Verrucomicrobiota bacterium]